MVDSDYLTEIRELSLTARGNEVVLNVEGNAWAIAPRVHFEIAMHCGITNKFYGRLLRESPELLARRVNRLFGATEGRCAIRTIDGCVYSFIADVSGNTEMAKVLEESPD